MRILFVGDVVAGSGCAFLRQRLPQLRREWKIDFCIVNGENSADGNGVSRQSLDHLLTSGADLVTGGNHTLRREEIYDALDAPYPVMLRPANYHAAAPGKGKAVIEKGRLRLGVINLAGQAFMDPADNPFDAADRLLEELKNEGVCCTFVDFHAEATGEKRALALYLDGRVGAVCGTHTHVQTADAQILPGGTAYLTDVGMTGAKHSVLGVTPDAVIRKLRTGLPARFTAAQGEMMLNCAVIDLDEKTGRAMEIEALTIE